MKPEYVFMLLGGLGLFLCGMQMMSSNLEAVAGDRLKGILEKLTSNRILGVLVGAVITAVIQSSSATTVMVVGFVNSGLMTLRQAVWIIMGANIGTTITGQLVALDIGGRPFLNFDCGGELSRGKIGSFDAELVEEFLRAFANNAGLNIYVKLLSAGNMHHEAEAIFKALAQCLRAAVAVVSDKIPSSKGVL